MELNPAQFRLLLAGPKVARLLPFVSARGYVADACTSGAEALDFMRESPRHVLLVELEMDDMLLADLLEHVRRENLAGAVILLDDPAKSGLIVSTLIRGVDGYVATPPDELYLFRLIERQLLAQWALAQADAGAQSAQDKVRAEKSLQLERAKVTELVKEIASLREEVQRTKAQLGKPGPRPTASTPDPAAGFENEETDIGVQVTQKRPSASAAPRMPVQSVADDKTSPRGHARSGGIPSGARGGPGSHDDDGFATVAKTRPANTEELPTGPQTAPATKPTRRPAPAPAVEAEADDPDLFLDVEDDGATAEVTPPKREKRPDNRFLLDDD